MFDPHEGVNPDGTIRTGVDRRRVPAAFEPVIAALLDAVPPAPLQGRVSLLLYGSVVTGAARSPSSDVDAFAGLMSVRDGGWTTDRPRRGAARRWLQQDPTIAEDVEELLAWSQSLQSAQHPDLQRALDDEGVVSRVVEHFLTEIGLWR